MKTPLILDGAMGTELQNRGIDIPLPLWSANANIEHSQIVTNIHEDYIEAGSDIITTNTFRSTPWTYKKAGYGSKRSKELARSSLYKAVECAQKAVVNSVKIAGSITAVEDCYSPNDYPGRSIAEDTYGYALEWLFDAGIDIVLFETMGNIEEISCALEMINDNKLPVWLSIIMKDDRHILDNTLLKDVFTVISQYNLDCIMTNCNQIDTTINSIENILSVWDGKWGAYPNLGNFDYENEYFNIIDESNFHRAISTLISYKPDVFGLCCGSTPNHIKELKNLLNKIG